MCSPRGRSRVENDRTGDRAEQQLNSTAAFWLEKIKEETMRVQARRALLVDAAIGLALAVASWMASFYVWAGSEYGRPDWRHGPPRHMVTIVDSSPWVLPAVLAMALGVATRRIWPRAAFVATVVGVGIYLAAGAMFPPIFLGPALAVYAMASGASI